MTALLENPTARVKWLATPSSASWLEQANARPDLVLIDHAHCERKAAGVALQLMFRYPSDEGLAGLLSPLAREELEHFELVLQLLQRRGIPLRPLSAPGYGATLTAAVRKGEREAFNITGPTDDEPGRRTKRVLLDFIDVEVKPQ